MQSLSLAQRMEPLLKRVFYTESVFIAVRGRNKTGKTNLVFLLMELTYALGLFTHYCGNVPITGNSFPYKVVRDLQSLKAYCKSLPPGSKIFFFFDELGKNAPKITPWAKLNVGLLTSLQVLRKYHLTLVVAFIGDSVSNKILDPNFLDSWIDKRSKTFAIVHDWYHGRTTKLKAIPKCKVEYDEFADVSFSATQDVTQQTNWVSSAEWEVIQKRQAHTPLNSTERSIYNRLKERVLKFYLSNADVAELQLASAVSDGGSSNTQA